MDEDLRLIRKMQDGDESAIERFVEKYYPDILKYSLRHLPSRQDAEDVTQEVFARFFRHFEQYRHYGKAKNYLYVIARNLCTDYYRSPPQVPPDIESPPGPDIDARLDLETALARLDPELREVLILHYFQDLKFREIADILDIGLPLVKYRAARAKAQLQDCLREETAL